MMLDELTNTIAKRVALLKIDTEGFEGHVFNGAWRFIERHRPAVIAFEFDPSWIREKSPFEPADILRRLSNMGYMRDDNGLVPIEPFSMSQVRSEVFLAVRAQ